MREQRLRASVPGTGLCSLHYRRWQKHENPNRNLCSIKGCENTGFQRGWCPAHYSRWRRNGDPEKVTRHYRQPERRFWQKTDRNGPVSEVRPDLGRCWLWLGTIGPDGYARLSVDGQDVTAYRFGYELLVGPIPQGLEPDHLCRVRHCVNPAHLEPVTHSENVRRAFAAAK